MLQRFDRHHRGDPAVLVGPGGCRVRGVDDGLAQQLAHALAALGGQPDRGLALLQPGAEVRDARPPAGGQVEPGYPVKHLIEDGQREYLADPVGPELILAARDEIPPARLEDDAVRVQHPGHVGRRGPAPVPDLDPALIPHRAGDGGQLRR